MMSDRGARVREACRCQPTPSDRRLPASLQTVSAPWLLGVWDYSDPGTVESMVTRTALMVPVIVATGAPEALMSSVPSQAYTFRV